jgi:CTP synthase (UTP-ammonia lyase)
VYSSVIAKERRGEYLGDTVQVIRTSPMRSRAASRAMAQPDAEGNRPDVVITEIGGTVGDIESLPFRRPSSGPPRGRPRELLLSARVIDPVSGANG